MRTVKNIAVIGVLSLSIIDVSYSEPNNNLIPTPKLSRNLPQFEVTPQLATKQLAEEKINDVVVKLERGNIATKSGVKRMVYTRFGDDIVVEGDIKIETPNTSTFSFGVPSIVGWLDEPRRWPDGEIPFEVESGFCCTAILNSAIDTWESLTPIRFVNRTDEENFLRIENQGAPPRTSWSTGIGMQSGKMTVKIQAASLSTDNNGDGVTDANDVTIATNAITSTTIHELGHVIGLMHEHTRPDRDSFIVRNTDCKPGIVDRWIDSTNSGINNDGQRLGGYDYRSIMHYQLLIADNKATSVENDVCSLYFRTNTCTPANNFSSTNCVSNFRDTTPTARDINGVWMMYGESLGSNSANEKFGHAILTNDINNDGYDDLVVGVPGDKVISNISFGSGGIGGVISGGLGGLLGDNAGIEFKKSGRVYLFRGSDRGLLPWMRITPPEPKDDMEFGYSLGFVDDSGLRGNAFGRLAIGAPGELLSGRAAAGSVYLFDLLETEAGAVTHLMKDGFFFAGLQETGDRFGHSLAVGKFRTPSEIDLAIGAPGARHSAGTGNEPRAGAVFILQNMTRNPNVGGAARLQLLDSEMRGRGRIGDGLATVVRENSSDRLAITAPGTRSQLLGTGLPLRFGSCQPKVTVVEGAPSASPQSLDFEIVGTVQRPLNPAFPFSSGRHFRCSPVVADVPADQYPLQFQGAGFGAIISSGDIEQDGLSEFAVSSPSFNSVEDNVVYVYGVSGSEVSLQGMIDPQGTPSKVGAIHFGDYAGDGTHQIFVGLPDQVSVKGYSFTGQSMTDETWSFTDAFFVPTVDNLTLGLTDQDYFAGAITTGNYRQSEAPVAAFGVPGAPQADKPIAGSVLLSQPENDGRQIVRVVQQELESPYSDE